MTGDGEDAANRGTEPVIALYAEFQRQLDALDDLVRVGDEAAAGDLDARLLVLAGEIAALPSASSAGIAAKLAVAIDLFCSSERERLTPPWSLISAAHADLKRLDQHPAL